MHTYLIVGGVAGGASTAARLRRLNEKARIVMFEKGTDISYANCGLPYYIGGVIQERDRLFVQTPQSFFSRLAVEVKTRSEVVAIDRKAHAITVKNLETGETYVETYDKLVLSPGAEPVRPPIPGIGDQAIFTLRNVPDTDRIKEFIETRRVSRAVVVGAGFIGLEMAENLKHKGVFVTIVEMAEQVMTPLDYEMAAEVHQHLKTKKVEFYLGDAVNSFVRQGETLHVNLKSGRSLEADLVVLSIGVRPDSRLAGDAGIELAPNKGILVNEYLQTSDPDIYAVGDAICLPSPITGKQTITYLAGPANKQGRIAADNIVRGNLTSYPGAIGTAIAKVFDLTVGSTGVSEKVLKQEGIPYQSAVIHGSSHAGYYPDAMPMTLKIVFDPEDGRLYGAQAVGFEGVDKRVDLLATVVRNHGTIYDLQAIEHAYAPPYSSAKDPVNVAGLVAGNIIEGLTRIVHWQDIAKIDFADTVLIDVRTAEEFKLGAIDGAINISVDDIRQRLNEIPRDKRIIVYCGVGQRGYFAGRILEQNDYKNVFNLTGGYKTWQHAIQKQSNEDIFAHDIIHKDDLIYQSDPDKKPGITVKVDACGLQCPGPIMRLKQEMDKVSAGDIVTITANDPGFSKDVPAWCGLTGHTLENIEMEKGRITASIRKGQHAPVQSPLSTGGNKTIVVFSDDLDRALASFVIANGAASTGKKVTLFFTFWGLNVIKRTNPPRRNKGFMDRMFAMMMPANSSKLGLSKINFGGMGARLMRKQMQWKNVDSLEHMINAARESGVEMIACQMSMDVMGVTQDELIDGVVVGGVATYLAEADKAGLNLFI